MEDQPPQLPAVLPLQPTTMLPPPLPGSAHASSSSGSSGRKRKRGQDSPGTISASVTRRRAGSQSSTTSHTTLAEAPAPASTRASSRASNAFSETTKESIRDLDGGYVCWHCGASPTDICHVITKQDHQFRYYKETGILNIKSLGDLDNGIPLCPLCHRNFDDHNNPGFVFVPTDIAYFRSFEQRDIVRRRERYALSGTRANRICPTSGDYRQHQLDLEVITASHNGGLYARYTIRDYFPRGRCCSASMTERIGELYGPASWHGDPMAALRRGFAFTSSPSLGGMPYEKWREVRDLHDLYVENDVRYGRECHHQRRESPDSPDLAANHNQGEGASAQPDRRQHSPRADSAQHSETAPTALSTLPVSRSYDPPGPLSVVDDGTESLSNKPVAPSFESFEAPQRHLERRSSPTQPDHPECGLPLDPWLPQIPSQLCSNSQASSPTAVVSDSGISSKKDCEREEALSNRRRYVGKYRPGHIDNLYDGKWQWGPLATCQDVVDFYKDVTKYTRRRAQEARQNCDPTASGSSD